MLITILWFWLGFILIACHGHLVSLHETLTNMTFATEWCIVKPYSHANAGHNLHPTRRFTIGHPLHLFKNILIVENFFVSGFTFLRVGQVAQSV